MWVNYICVSIKQRLNYTNLTKLDFFDTACSKIEQEEKWRRFSKMSAEATTFSWVELMDVSKLYVVD